MGHTKRFEDPAPIRFWCRTPSEIQWLWPCPELCNFSFQTKKTGIAALIRAFHRAITQFTDLACG